MADSGDDPNLVNNVGNDDPVAGDGGDGNLPPVVESESDEDVEPAYLDPDHPLMERVQAALAKTLQSADDKITLELREKQEGVAQIKKKREQIGVELYGFQQGLAKLQLALEKTHEKYQQCRDNRHQAEADLKDMNEAYQQRLLEKKALEERSKKTQRELDKLKITVSQIDEFNEKVKSEILVTRRAAYGTEENMQKLEQKKKDQDELIDGLNEQLRTMKEQIRMFEAQIASQKEETMAAQETLSEALREMDNISVHKREYLHKWRASLVGMAARDKALAQAQKAAHDQKEQMQHLDMAIKGYKQSVKAEQEKNEKLSEIGNKLEHEISFVTQQCQLISESHERFSEQYLALRSSLEQNDQKLQVGQQVQRELKAEIEHVHQKYEKLMQEKQKLDDTILENFSSRTTIEKGAQNVWKNTEKLKRQAHEKEIKLGEIQNEVARIKVDSLNTSAHNKELKQTLSAYDKELKEKDKLIEKYEMEIRQRHDKIEKKQIYIARLNRKYEQLTSNKQVDENTGPLEATIKNLKKEIATITRSSSQKQREWIKTQTELVTLVSKTEKEEAQVKEQKARETILSQKRIRLQSEFVQVKKEIKELGQAISGMHTEMTKMNNLISKTAAQQEKLANKNYTLETEFIDKLKDLELESVEMDAEIARLKSLKEDILNEIVEVEKQLMLWEKKIQLERETQEALDPEFGQPEIKGMKKEIHRMKNRLTKLKRQQELMLKEMERTIAKRESIKLSRIGNPHRRGEPMSKAQLRKKVKHLKGNLSSTAKESKQIASTIQRQEDSNKVLLEELERQQQQFNEINDQRAALSRDMEETYFSRQVNLEAILAYQEKAKCYEDALRGDFKAPGDLNTMRQELAESEQQTIIIQDALARLMDDHPKHAEWFQRFAKMKL